MSSPAENLVPVLEYGDRRDDARGRRWALASFLWSLLSPATVAAVVYLLGEGMLDIDDLLPRSGAIAVFACVGMGIPFAGVLAGAAAGTRARTKGQKWLAAGAIVLGAVWSVAAFALLVVVVNA